MPNIQLQFRRGTALEWSVPNPTLASGEMGIETDTSRFKIGNGTSGWNALSYGGLIGPTGSLGPTGGLGPTGAASSVTGPTGPTGILGDTVVNWNVTGVLSIQETQELVNAVAAPTTTQVFNWTTGAIFYVTGITGNFTANITNLPLTANRSYVVAFVLVQGGTAYMLNALQIGGGATTIRWNNAVAPTGTANRWEIVSFVLIYTGVSWIAIGNFTSYG